ncbi:universal stress protein [Flavobacteriaceae bacterium 144Ye]|jgi:nucleotide-binding universal stress UspA family protein|uniref:Nucleotide-binding universal stress protein, UspA family n=2 Tax=Flavobacteriaceae TaxID=49546 RepID=A0A1K1NCH1_9FLAO|nr:MULTISPECIES: universal stress protein [Flavobacteriaceae]MDE1206276.1 universal stress protein [Tenacibaculum larymnensis]RYH75849.1 universal stress protein [Flavobacteriaceae bacterium 144Ye]SFW33130.1 Nucleotide-binding universal stress protein, UspA family [Sinomicrobium oceani]
MKNILVPTDFSKNCNKAEELGIEMAKLYNSEIHFFHLMKTPVDWVKLDKQKEKRYPETLKEIGVVKSKLRELEKKAEHEGLKCRTFLQFDSGQKDILEHSGHFHHDFIVTGSSGTRGGIRELMGSNVEKIVRKADVPVVVVKDEEVSFPFKDIVFVSDFLQDVSDAFKQVISIAEKCGAHIHLLRVNTQTDFNSIEQGLNPINEFLKKFPDLDNFSMNVYNEPDVETGINNFLRYKNADLIAMCTHGRTGFLSLFSKSIAEGITNHSELPVMTIKM